MKGKYKAALVLLLLSILVSLALVMTSGLRVSTLVGVWLPVGTRIALNESPRLTRHGLHIPELCYLVEDCLLARIIQVDLPHPSRWALSVDIIELDSACLARLPQAESSSVAPKTLAKWQSMLSNTWISTDKLTLSPWREQRGELSLSLIPSTQQLHYQGEKAKFQGRLHGQNFTVMGLDVATSEGQPPVELAGELTMPLVPDGPPASGHVVVMLGLP